MKLWTTKLLKIALALCVLTTLAAAEDKLPARFVRVVGTAEVKVVPDRAVIEVGVEKQDPSASVAKHAEDAAARRILATLRGNGIDEKNPGRIRSKRPADCRELGPKGPQIVARRVVPWSPVDPGDA
jgi:uncharacterized protein YggE